MTTTTTQTTSSTTNSTTDKSVRKEFTVRFHLASNEETGEEFVLESDRQIEQNLAAAAADFDQKMNEYRLGGMAQDTIDRSRRSFEAQQQALRHRMVSERDAVLPLAVEHVFTLVKPDWGQRLQIQADAEVVNEQTGVPTFNEAIYCDLLLKNDGVRHGDKESGGKVLTAVEIDRLDPAVSQELGRRLVAAIDPDPRRLPFVNGCGR